MLSDVLFLVILAVFFAVCIGYVRLCDRIIGPDPQVSSAVPQEREDVAP